MSTSEQREHERFTRRVERMTEDLRVELDRRERADTADRADDDLVTAYARLVNWLVEHDGEWTTRP